MTSARVQRKACLQRHEGDLFKRAGRVRFIKTLGKDVEGAFCLSVRIEIVGQSGLGAPPEVWSSAELGEWLWHSPGET